VQCFQGAIGCGCADTITGNYQQSPLANRPAGLNFLLEAE
jgi:hypothetical protein